MSVPNQTPYNIYTANGLTTVFTYEFYIISASDLRVSINGDVVTSGYTVAGVGNKDGGDITFLTPPANGAVVMLERVVPTYRLTDYQDNGDLLADTVNKDFDRIWMAIQRAFIDLGFALTRPLFGGPFNAKGYRIANLADPVNAQDAATKNYVIEHGKTNLARTLRVPEQSVAILPTLALRKNKLLAFNDLGDPISVLPESGSAADVMIELASAHGSELVHRNNTSVSRIIRACILEYMTPEDQEALLTVSGGVVDCDYALKDAIADGVMVLDIPWVLGSLELGSDPATLPLGFSIQGWSCRRPYTISGDGSFLGCGVVIRVAAGAKFPFYSTGRHDFKNINFDGRDKTTQLLYSANSGTQFNGTRFEGCGIYRFAVGLGWSGYTGTLFATRCSISGNGDGVRNLIDSNLIGCVVNANGRGVVLQQGANNNSFIGVRVEWNNGYNYFAYNAIENIILGELCDRAGSAGIVASGGSSWYVSGTVVRRSGKNEPVGSDYSANFLIIDSGEFIINGIRTRSGVDDTGSGVSSPSFGVSVIGSGTPKFTATGCDLSGYVTKALSRKQSASMVVSACLGMPDYVNVGSSKHMFGRDCLDSKTGTLAAVKDTVISFPLEVPVDDESGPVQWGAYVTRKLHIECRLSDQRFDLLDIPILFKFEDYRSIVNITSRLYVSSARIGIDDNATGVRVLWTLNSTGDILTVTLTSVDGVERKCRVTLLPVM
ncbi:TPA: hypothetical protein NEG33_004651 [Klebsiella pneumoniae]|uniref:phage tail fiber domain-containing protein n=1 Tax=Klebsiella TaxID=570 RepID=UPI000BD6C489|nr:phage tail fiber protein [Klebsiella pneumoniae]MBC4941140.1 hypothetical protein [Klebsiella pneumoniae]MBM7254655.1 hypothetical protein [Klebsiella pneumoniae]MBZ6623228.1 hypothetical protein [Klebsiella pneumoniae]MCK4189733.1 hypothetical protein [Klebsiella pneumoniae]MDT9812962.1 phage tail fiber protein [Klebsiella pneumoniae]